MLSVFWKSLIVAACIGTLMFLSFAFLSWKSETQQNRAVGNRLIQRLDTDALITELALAKLENRLPSLKAQEYWEKRSRELIQRTEDSGPRLVAPE